MQYKKTQSTVYFERGRLCNPYLGMFTLPDREISDVDNSQAYNRFSYALVNPLKYSDPTGYSPEQNIGEREATGVTHTTGVYLSSWQAYFTPSAKGTGQSSDIAFADGGMGEGVEKSDDWYYNNQTGKLEWHRGSEEKKGYRYLGEDLEFHFSSYIDRASFDGMYGIKDFLDFSGEKLYSRISLDFTQNENGDLVGQPDVSINNEILKTFDLIKGSKNSSLPNIDQVIISLRSDFYAITFERHAIVNKYLEMPFFPILGYDVVNVAQRLEIIGDKNTITFSASTDVFPSARLTINNLRVMNYLQPSFQTTHSLFSSPEPALYPRTRNFDW